MSAARTPRYPTPRRSDAAAAYAYGSEPLLVQTLENLLKVRVHHVAKTSFEGFKNMTDAVGGVPLHAEESSNGNGVDTKKGWNDLNGTQALALVRARHQLSEGDISRGAASSRSSRP